MKNIYIHQLAGLMLALLLSFSASAQQSAFKGFVVDADTGSPLEAVTVYAANGQSAITNAQGQFEMQDCRAGDPLTINYLGYEEQRVPAANTTMVIALKNSPILINQVVVSASRDMANRTVQPLAISALSLRQIQETNATSLYQLMNKTTGVNMVDLGNDQHSLSIRQPNSTRAVYLFLEDGVPIRPTGVFNHNALIEMNLASLRNIEIIRGPASSIYGSGAIGGAINFMTHQPTVQPSGRIATQFDNIGYRGVEFRAANTFGKVGLAVSGSYAGRRDGYREYSDYDKYGVSVATRIKLSNTTFLNSSFSMVDYRTDATVSVDSSDFFSRDFGSVHNFAYRIVEAMRAQSTLQKIWDNRNQTDFTVFYRKNFIGQNATHTIRNDSNNPLRGSSQISDLGFESYGSIVQHKFQFRRPNTRLIAGAMIDYSPVETENRFITVTRNEEGDYVDFQDPDSLLTLSEIGLLNVAAYAQLEMALSEKVNVVAGLRYDKFVYNHNNFLDGAAFSGAPDSRNVYSNLTPKIGINYNPSDKLGAYANFSMGFVPPQTSELYRGVKVPVLGPMTFFNYEAGGWYKIGKLGYVEVSLYNLRGSNEIINVLLDDGTFENRNAGKTNHYGIEYSLVLMPTDEVSLRFNGTNARHIFSEYPERGVDFDGNDMPGAPGWIANAELQYKPRWVNGLSVTVEGYRVGAYFMDQSNSEKYPGYYLLNARLGYEWRKFNLWVNMINLTDELYAVNASKSAAGKRYSIADPRNFAVGMAIQFGKVK